MTSQILNHVHAEPSVNDRILLVACECFARDGIHGTKVRTIAEEAGVPLGSLHYHFGNKEMLFAQVIKFLLGVSRQLGDQIDSVLAKLKDEGVDQKARVEAMLGMWVDFHFDHPEISQIALHQIAEFDSEQPLQGDYEVIPTDNYASSKASSFFNLPNTQAFKAQMMASNMAITGFVGAKSYHQNMFGKNMTEKKYRNLIKSTMINVFAHTFYPSIKQ